MNASDAYAWLRANSQEKSILSSIGELLAWDQRTVIPTGGHAHRARQLALVAKLVHQRGSDPRIGELLAIVDGSALSASPSSPEAINIREWRRRYERARKVPERLIVELAEAAALGESAWEHARPNNDWASFAGHLTRLVQLKREVASALGYQHEPYDALLEDYEPGLTTQQIEALFGVLRPALVALLARIRGARRRPNPAVLRGRFPRSKQEALGREAARRIGYDFTRGRLDSSAHPFTMSAGPNDVRITTRYDQRYFPTAFFATLHEAGHALYEQGLPAEHAGTPIGEPASLGIHESQSRLWENLVGRSVSFWRYFLKRAQGHCAALAGVSLDEFVFAINGVEPSLIRVEADEVTYNLHIVLRFELELLLLRGDLTVADLPAAWDEKMRSLLGILPPDAASGVLQDVHWASGAFGYFPTYTVGNLAAAQFFKQAQRDLGDLDRLFAIGDFAPFLDWLRRHVHIHGGRFWPRDLLRHVTGEDLSPAGLIEHLGEKYTRLYKL